MANVIYALSGEGRGHATRAQTVIEELRREHAVKVYTYGQAFEFLEPIYRGTNVDVRRIPGMNFHYTQNGTMDYLRTVLSATPYLLKLSARAEMLARELLNDAAALVITDFEPLMPRAAKVAGIPFVSLDHQHFLTAYDLSGLPARLRYYARCLSPWVHMYYSGQCHSIVSSFYEAPLYPGVTDVTRVGVLLRSEILEAEVSVGDHLVAYVRRHIAKHVIEALIELGQPVRVYGLGAMPDQGQVSFHAVDPLRFVQDLASSRALVSTAGNQLVGEALYLRKPVLGMPETGNYEQEINAHFLQASGMGETCSMREFDVERLRGFLSRVESLRAHIDPSTVCGNRETLSVLRKQINSVTGGSRPNGAALREDRSRGFIAP
jgi:uncharacterized protein (TIGR00661 family)